MAAIGTRSRFRFLPRLAFACTLLLAPVLLRAQGDTIIPAPNARELRIVWQVAGNIAGGSDVGAGVGSLGDIFGTGRSAWAVNFGGAERWKVYRFDGGRIDTVLTPVVSLGNYGPIPAYPVVGDFWGTGHRAIGFGGRSRDTANNKLKYYYELHIYRTDSNRIADTEAAILNTRRMNPPRQTGEPGAVLTADLNGDGADELLVLHSSLRLDTGLVDHSEIWVYRGGSAFQVDSPTVILTCPLSNIAGPRVTFATGDFDGDGHRDIALARSAHDTLNYLLFFWGSDDLTNLLHEDHQRLIRLASDYPDARWEVTSLDCDGDRITDLAIDRGWDQATRQGVYLFRSGSGRNARSRSFRMDDADQWFKGSIAHHSGGFINDSAGRFEALCIMQFGFDQSVPSHSYFLSGGSNGPDHSYEAYTNYAFPQERSAGDVDGDGWPDYICGDYRYGGFNSGLAVIYAGGPYIPGPDVAGVDPVAGEGHAQAVALWPNPVRDMLHIAWRGDLLHMPARFSVHDMLGRQVAHGDVRPSLGEALWDCSTVPAGVYILSIHDAHGTLLASARVIRV
ncbi:MAG TPA: FG-GAP-like repeat-containing protein [Candidatus Kapabacteria bacterium]|nr:FG-GAP-like repeat-containing protein [Candidatus Kapabacteria bacterium]